MFDIRGSKAFLIATSVFVFLFLTLLNQAMSMRKRIFFAFANENETLHPEFCIGITLVKIKTF